MSDSVNKAYEVALACAAQDGLAPEELMSMADSIRVQPLPPVQPQWPFAHWNAALLPLVQASLQF